MRPRLILGSALLLLSSALLHAEEQPKFWKWAEKPVMGWNSWDCFGTSVTEKQIKEHADYIAKNLKEYGYTLVTVDIQWYEPKSTGFDYRKNAELVMDEWSRLIPATSKFPSADKGVGFKKLAEYVHGKGLKFGIHMMRGISRQAVNQNTPIKGTTARAKDIADTSSTCSWNGDMYGVDTTKPGAQEYYDSIMELCASWGVDFVKIDDLSRPYHKGEIEAIRKAIDKCGRPIVLSTSPGETPVAEGAHVMQHANQWRISDDFWDSWKALKEQFARLNNWTPYRGPGYFPDADMLPVGKIGAGNDKAPGRTTNFTKDEQYTLMSLWSIARSPLIIGADLGKMDPFTLELLTNKEVLAVDQDSTNNRQLFNHDDHIAWVADVPGTKDKYVALFNARDAKPGETTQEVELDLSSIGITGACQVRDLWQKKNIGTFKGNFAPKLPFHGAGLYRIRPQ
jgi:alpha-galactosidase